MHNLCITTVISVLSFNVHPMFVPKHIYFLTLSLAGQISFVLPILHGFNNKSNISSVVGGAIRDVTTRIYVGISVDRTVKLLCDFWLFYVAQQGN